MDLAPSSAFEEPMIGCRIHLAERLATDRRVALGLGALYAIVGFIRCADPATLHDEGLLTYGFARAMDQDLIATLFFQKARPVLSLLYAPVALAGLTVFLVVHVVVAAAAIPLVAATARVFGIRNANLAALVVACSPVFLWCGPMGLSNSDGAAGLALVVYLLAARRAPFVAGAVLGGLPWIR